jgi:antitoxin (DNA-binding transcriptional repressor) of toxin-antitoxin stability system
MSTHSVAEAQDKLSELIDRARKGEEVVITRDGTPVARLDVLPEVPRAVLGALDSALDWLERRRATRPTMNEDAGTFVSRMRDEEWTR